MVNVSRQRRGSTAPCFSDGAPDSVLFLQIAFGSLDFIEGRIIGKIWRTIFARAGAAGAAPLGRSALQPPGRRANRAADRLGAHDRGDGSPSEGRQPGG
jgi:hypothetical protein